LNAVYFGAEEFLFGCQNFQVHVLTVY
jgi:hypothetical protein